VLRASSSWQRQWPRCVGIGDLGLGRNLDVPTGSGCGKDGNEALAGHLHLGSFLSAASTWLRSPCVDPAREEKRKMMTPFCRLGPLCRRHREQVSGLAQLGLARWAGSVGYGPLAIVPFFCFVYFLFCCLVSLYEF
jgi:hypothetical protein